jgi:hypothetical protein
MASAPWARSADAELAIEIMNELERADLDIEPGHKPNRTMEPKRDHHECEDPAQPVLKGTADKYRMWLVEPISRACSTPWLGRHVRQATPGRGAPRRLVFVV